MLYQLSYIGLALSVSSYDSSLIPEALSSLLSDFEVLPVSGLQQHSLRKRDVHTESQLERIVSFSALKR
jgi:disintegrin and metalloproteinase domain-containing protein 17